MAVQYVKTPSSATSAVLVPRSPQASTSAASGNCLARERSAVQKKNGRGPIKWTKCWDIYNICLCLCICIPIYIYISHSHSLSLWILDINCNIYSMYQYIYIYRIVQTWYISHVPLSTCLTVYIYISIYIIYIYIMLSVHVHISQISSHKKKSMLLHVARDSFERCWPE
jgi:hypothetical protein